jgi:predicted dinucleotide-binding enzyme
MKDDKPVGVSRRHFTKRALIATLVVSTAPLFSILTIAKTTNKSFKIGIIGSGNIGGSVGVLWAQAGHQVFFSSRHPEQLEELASKAGPTAKVGYPEQAAEFGDVIFIAVAYHAMPKLGEDLSPLMQGKVVLDCSNPYPSRDGDMALAALEKGTGIASAEFFPGVRLVRAYNSISHQSILTQAHRKGEQMAIPLAADDDDALQIASKLITDSGFDPVFVGPLSRAREFDNRSALYGMQGTAQDLREAFGL